MTNRFLISAAAVALIAGTGFANAQGTGTTREAPSAGSTVQQSAPSSERGAPSAAPMNREGASDAKGAADHGMKATQSDEKMPQGSKNQRAQDDAKPGMKGEKSAQDNVKGEKSKSMSSETQDKGAASKDMKADSKGAADNKSQTTTQSQSGQKSPSQTTTQAPAGQSNQSQTTGNAATSATAAPPAEKRTQITSAFKQERVEQVTNVNFNVAIGTAVPASVRFHPIPSRIVEIYPEWRGYDFIIVNGRYVILRPQTHEIVYIIEG
jgi:hypothetical protein